MDLSLALTLGSRMRTGVRTAPYSDDPTAAYAVAGLSPNLVADAINDFFYADAAERTFDEMFSYTGASLKTTVDSDGVLKWAPHNLQTYSDDLTQWTADSGASIVDASTFSTTNAGVTAPASASLTPGNYTVEIELWSETDAGEQVDFGFNTSNATNTFSSAITLTSEPTTYSFTRTEANTITASIRIRNVGGLAKTVKVGKARIYRSDLGGMQNNPDTGDSYVPTTTSARYLPRRGHHIWDGTAWVNKGLLIESEARTNLFPLSREFDNSSAFVGWTLYGVTLLADETGPDGEANSAFTVTATNSTAVLSTFALSIKTGINTLSVFIKQGTASVAWLYLDSLTNGAAFFDLSDESTQALAGSSQTPANLRIEKVGTFYRVSATWNVTQTNGSIGFGISNVKGSWDTTTVGSSLIFYGAQIEAGSTPSSYIPTAGATVTRAAETRPATAAILPSSTTAQSGSLQGLITYADLGTAGQVTLYDRRVDANNRITITLDTDGAKTGTVTLTMVNGGASATVSQVGLGPGINEPFNIAWRVSGSDINIAVNGTAATATSTAIGVPTLAAVNATYSGLRVDALERGWDGVALTDAQLEEATA